MKGRFSCKSENLYVAESASSGKVVQGDQTSSPHDQQVVLGVVRLLVRQVILWAPIVCQSRLPGGVGCPGPRAAITSQSLQPHHSPPRDPHLSSGASGLSKMSASRKLTLAMYRSVMRWSKSYGEVPVLLNPADTKAVLPAAIGRNGRGAYELGNETVGDLARQAFRACKGFEVQAKVLGNSLKESCTLEIDSR